MTQPVECADSTRALASPTGEQRTTDRHALMIRGAKLVCRNGEYLCIVRDVSQSGVRLRLFHQPPPDPRMVLELANGAAHLIEPVWHRDEEAGFRFTTPIDVPAFIAEPGPYPRRALRLHIRRAALAFSGDSAREAELIDLSQYGACIRMRHPLPIGQKIRLEADGLPPLVANICWRTAERHGLAFRQSFAFDALARLAGKLQGTRQDRLAPDLPRCA